MLWTRVRQAALALLIAGTLSACGGGGGGDSAPARTTSGLVPAPGALGATLYPDAKVLRPLIPSGKWTYHGQRTGSPAYYYDTLTQAAAQGGGVTESATNIDFNGAAEQTVSYVGGAVQATSALDLGNGQTQVVNEVELRSPVRVNDQYTILDMHLADSGVDLDGDGRNDAFDFAAYRQVIGAETVDLVNFPQAPAVHLRMTVVARFQLTKTGGFTDATTGTLDTWYTQGVGIVKRVSDMPGDALNGDLRITSTEELVHFDGITKGVGFLDETALTTMSGAPVTSPIAAISMDTHALLLTRDGNNWAMSVHKVDARGNVVATHSLDAFSPGARIVRVGTGARVLVGDEATGLRMFTLDADGAPASASPVQLIDGPMWRLGTGAMFEAAASGDTLWVAWARQDIGPPTTYQFLTTPFDLAGQPKSAPFTLAPVRNPNDVTALSAQGSGGHAIFVWNISGVELWAVSYARMEAGSANLAPDIHAFGPLTQPMDVAASPAAMASGTAMLWSTLASDYYDVAGVTFDTLGEIRRSNSGALEQEKLVAPWLNPNTLIVVGSGVHIDLASFEPSTKVWPEERSQGAFTVTELTVGAGALATDNGARLLVRGVHSTPFTVVGLNDNVLLFNSDSGDGASVTSVWRRQ